MAISIAPFASFSLLSGNRWSAGRTISVGLSMPPSSTSSLLRTSFLRFPSAPLSFSSSSLSGVNEMLHDIWRTNVLPGWIFQYLKQSSRLTVVHVSLLFQISVKFCCRFVSRSWFWSRQNGNAEKTSASHCKSWESCSLHDEEIKVSEITCSHSWLPQKNENHQWEGDPAAQESQGEKDPLHQIKPK